METRRQAIEYASSRKFLSKLSGNRRLSPPEPILFITILWVVDLLQLGAANFKPFPAGHHGLADLDGEPGTGLKAEPSLTQRDQ